LGGSFVADGHQGLGCYQAALRLRMTVYRFHHAEVLGCRLQGNGQHFVHVLDKDEFKVATHF